MGLGLLVALILVVWNSHAEPSSQHNEDGGVVMLAKMAKLETIFGARQAIDPQKELLVLGAGFARTGTKSTKAALKMMGYKVMHMEDIMENNLGPEVVYAASSDAALKRFVDKILALGYNATLDVPMNGLVFKLAKMFPKAKILYNIRESPESWEESFTRLNSKFRMALARPAKYLANFDWLVSGTYDVIYNFTIHFPRCNATESYWLQKLPWYDCYSPTGIHGVPSFAETYRRWDKRVRETFEGSGRLLVFRVQEGWGPLSNFLGKPVPNVPFPKVNEAAVLEGVDQVLTILAITWPFVLMALLILFSFIGEYFAKLLRRLASKGRAWIRPSSAKVKTT